MTQTPGQEKFHSAQQQKLVFILRTHKKENQDREKVEDLKTMENMKKRK